MRRLKPVALLAATLGSTALFATAAFAGSYGDTTVNGSPSRVTAASTGYHFTSNGVKLYAEPGTSCLIRSVKTDVQTCINNGWFTGTHYAVTLYYAHQTDGTGYHIAGTVNFK